MLKVNKLRCGYEKVEVIKGISFTEDFGNNLCIVGPNGCGKSTLLKAMAGLLDYKGSIEIEGKELKSYERKDLAKKVAYMAQGSSIYFPYTVYEAVSLGRYPHLSGIFGRLSKKDEEIILESIESVGLMEVKDKLISELSGGQLQRVYLARAFAQDPDIILLDEPTNHLDLKCQIEILEHLKLWSKKNNKMVVAVLHDLNLVQSFGENVIMMNEGTIVSKGLPTEVLRGETLNNVYGVDVKEFMVNALEKWKEVI